MSTNTPGILIGTSGWSYRHWHGPFYPGRLPASEALAFYSRHFDSAEINNTFYQLPARRTLAEWRDSVPPDFVFAAKASRYITHRKKLAAPRTSTRRFLARIAALGEKLGPVLFQLPPRWRCDRARLAAFLAALPRGLRCAFEFRDRTWFNQEIYELLARRNAALCIYDLAGYQSPRVITADFVYVRLHGPGAAYRGCYSASALAGWARAIARWTGAGLPAYCYFDNDEAGYAPRNARELAALTRRGRTRAAARRSD